jgi:hypothetical protein
MPAGTIALTNGSNAVSGTGTSFTTELKQGDFVYVTVGSAPYTLVVSSVVSNTQLTLSIAFDGPTTSGLAWNAVPASMQVAITQKILNDFAQVARGRILDLQNWQKIYSSDPSVTVTRPDRTQFTGPSWGYMAAQFGSMLSKDDNLASLADKAAARENLGLGDFATTTGNIPVIKGGTGASNQLAAMQNLGMEIQVTGNVAVSKSGRIITQDFLATGSGAIGAFNAQTIGGITWYTHYYKFTLPTAFPTAIISANVSMISATFAGQIADVLADIKARREVDDGSSISKTVLTVSIKTPQTGWTPTLNFHVTGY